MSEQQDAKRRAVAILAIVGFVGIAIVGGLAIYVLLSAGKPVGEKEIVGSTDDETPEPKKTDCEPQRPKATKGVGPQWFVDVTESWGVDFQHVVGPLGTYFMPESVGAGGALFDYDGDGDLDLYLVNSGRSPKASGEFPAGTRLESRLYRQDAPGKFTDATAYSGLAEAGYGVGCAVGDIDDDGFPDIYVTCFGQDRLFHNNGDGSFADVSREFGIDLPEWGTGVVFFDYDRDALLDLFVVNYTDDPVYNHAIACGMSEERVSYCGPLKFKQTIDRLLHNEGSLPGAMRPTFVDATSAAGVDAQTTYGFAVLAGDFSGDGWPDLYVASDAAPKRLWINQKNGKFRDEGVTSGAGYNMRGQPEGSMGLSMGDVDRDGDFDFVVSNLTSEGASLFLAGQEGMFEEVSERTGLRQATLPHTGWGLALVDLDHDGDLDCPLVNGLVIPCNSGFAPHGEETFFTRNEKIDDPDAYWRTYADPNLLFLNERGRFRDESASGGDFCSAVASGRGLIYGDIDDDGDLDLIVTNCGQEAKVYRNDLPKSGHWLKLRLVDPRGQRGAYGSLVTVAAGGKKHRRIVNPCDSYLASNDPRPHFGLGEASEYDSIEVKWPDGKIETYPSGESDRLVTIIRGSNE